MTRPVEPNQKTTQDQIDFIIYKNKGMVQSHNYLQQSIKNLI